MDARRRALCIRQTRTADADADANFVYSADLSRHVTIATPMVIFAVFTLLTVFDDWYTVGILLVQSW